MNIAHKFRELVHWYYSNSMSCSKCKIPNSPKLWWKYLIPSLWLCQHYLCVETCINSIFKYNFLVNKCFLSTYISITRCMLYWVIYCTYILWREKFYLTPYILFNNLCIFYLLFTNFCMFLIVCIYICW